MLKKYLPVGIGATGIPVVRLVPGTGFAAAVPGAVAGRVYADELPVGSSGTGTEPGDGSARTLASSAHTSASSAFYFSFVSFFELPVHKIEQ